MMTESARVKFSPNDPDFEARARASFARQRAMRALGVEIAQIEARETSLTMPFASEYTQQHGFMHAGIVTTALDSACGYAAFSLMPADAAVLTVEFKTNLLAPARGPLFRIEGRVIKPGRTISVVECRALQTQADGSDERLVATMTSTV